MTNREDRSTYCNSLANLHDQGKYAEAQTNGCVR